MAADTAGDGQGRESRRRAARIIGPPIAARPVATSDLESWPDNLPSESGGEAGTQGNAGAESSVHRNLPRPLRRTGESYRRAREADHLLMLALAEIDAVLAMMPEGGDHELEAAALALANQRLELVRALLDIIAERGDRQHPLPSVTALSEANRLAEGVSKAYDQFDRLPRWKKAVVAARHFAAAVGRMVMRHIESADFTVAVPLADGTLVSWTIRIRGPNHDADDRDDGQGQRPARA